MGILWFRFGAFKGPLMALSGRQLPPRDMSAVGDKADLRERRAEVG